MSNNNKAVIDLLLKYATIRTYGSKELVASPDRPNDKLFYIVSGGCRISVIGQDGQESILTFINKGDLIGVAGYFVNTIPREATVITREQSRIAEITYDRLKEVIASEIAPQQSIDLITFLAQYLANRLTKTNRKVSTLISEDMAGRIAHALVDLCSHPDSMTHPDGVQIKVSRQDIANMIGCSRELAGKTLKNFEERNLIALHGKTIVVFGDRYSSGFASRLALHYPGLQ